MNTIVRFTHGTWSVTIEYAGWLAMSLITVWLTIRPKTVPTTIAVSAMNDDSSRKLSWIIRRLKPIARRTPICWRRSTTARALITPRAATPTIRPRPMNPSISRLNVQLAATASSSSLSSESACRPDARNADSSFRASARAIDARCEVEVEDRRSHAVAERVPERVLRGRDPGHRERRLVGQHADHLQPDCRLRLRVAHLDRDRVEDLVLEVEPVQLEVGRHRPGAPVVAPRHHEPVDDREPGLLCERPPRVVVAAGVGGEEVRRVL